MKRYFTILEGQGKGEILPFEAGADYMLVGRSDDAGIKLTDAHASRRHLELRIKAGVVLAKNLSPNGFKHNGLPQTAGDEVRLKAGDELTVAGTKLQFCESSDQAESEVGGTKFELDSGDEERTRVAASDGSSGSGNRPKQEEDGVEPGMTRVAGSDLTKILQSNDVPLPKPLKRKQVKSLWLVRLWAALATALMILAIALWRSDKIMPSKSGVLEYLDDFGRFSLQYPAAWTLFERDTGLKSLGFGDTAGGNWARVDVRVDRPPELVNTGLNQGFHIYLKELVKRFPGFNLTGSKLTRINGIQFIHFGFTAELTEGLGLYTHDGAIRFIVECRSSSATYRNAQKDIFISILESFKLSSGHTQQYFDFPPPGETIRSTAAATPGKLRQEIEYFNQLGDAQMANRSVREDNLYHAVEHYRAAVQRQSALSDETGDEILQKMISKLRDASALYQQAVERQESEIKRALKTRDWKSVQGSASKLAQMIPDSSDPVRRRAEEILAKLQPASGK